MKAARLVLADEHTLMLEGLQKLLEPEFEVAGVAGDGRAFLSLASTTKPDLALLEIALPLLNGIDALMQLRKRSPRTKVIFVTAYEDREQVTEALRAGAAGYIIKRCGAAELRTAVREVARGRSYVSPLVTGELLSTFRSVLGSAGSRTELSARRREILQLIAEGHSLKDIARTLNLSQKTVEYHKYGMMQKLDLHTNAEIVQYAIEHRIIAAKKPVKRNARNRRE